MNNKLDPPFPLPLPDLPATQGSGPLGFRQDALGPARQLIHAGAYADAHRLLLALVAAHPTDPDLWLLLGWTAPTPLSARSCFQRLLSLQPHKPLAMDGLAQSDTGRDTLPSGLAQRSAIQRSGAVSQIWLHASCLACFVSKAGRRQYRCGLDCSRREAMSRDRQLRLDRPSTSPPPSRGITISPNIPPRTLGLLGLYLLGLALAEVVTAFLHPQAGLAIHGALLVVLFLHAALWASGPLQKLLYCLALAPLIRLLSLSMPLAQLQPAYWYAIIGLPLFLASLLALRLTGYTLAEVGLSLGRSLPLQALTALSGLGLGYLEYLILHPAPLVGTFTLRSIWLPALILLIFTGLLEELIFRGLLQRASHVLLGSPGLVYVSLAFAVLHIGYRSLPDFAFVFAVGLLFSLIAGRSRSILGVTLAHGLTNISLFLVFPFMLK